MHLAWLAWILSGMLALLMALSSLIPYAPGSEWLGSMLPVIFGTGAVFTAELGRVLRRLPPDHWANRSRGVRAALFGAAVASTLLVVLVI